MISGQLKCNGTPIVRSGFLFCCARRRIRVVARIRVLRVACGLARICSEWHDVRDFWGSAMIPKKVLAYHLIMTAYGFWLPNDPRGSWSDIVRSLDLLIFGPATKTNERSSVAHRSHDRRARMEAKSALRYPPIKFTGHQAAAIGRGFNEAVTEAGYVVHACAIMPDHAHVVIARHSRLIETIASHLKSKASRALTMASLHPLEAHRADDGTVPTLWARKHWSVFLSDNDEII